MTNFKFFVTFDGFQRLRTFPTSKQYSANFYGEFDNHSFLVIKAQVRRDQIFDRISNQNTIEDG